LSGGIGLAQATDLADFLKSNASKMCAVIDVNSTFENKDYTKNTQDLNLFINALKNRFSTK
jgi:phosphoribosylanthranilate isomerase